MSIATRTWKALETAQKRRRPQAPKPGRVLRLLLELLIIIPAYLSYHLVRGVVNGRIDDAFTNAHSLIHAEQTIGIFWEVWLQELILGHQLLIDTFNSIYIYGHMPFIAALALWLFFFRQAAFPRYRNAFLISGAIGLIFFVALPMAPPRMIADVGFVDTVTLYNEAYRVLQPPAFVNQYAAMPSLHFGWNLLAGIAIIQTTSSWYGRALGVLMPFAMLAGVIFTGNHYILDALAGAAIALAALWIATELRRRLQGTRVPSFLY